ncbi:CHASE2 domain-containing protein [Erythrobacter insulae]|uniref:histidine kinase n=1 Tax=Erythrobacter insulae TaxID=2584124 RepID=A0A547PCS3_9SPHN|nr:CHASE2 domain-containing protein [Erythrobacter insulae]TRD11941.1 CHASE2 domain-containing protein [Erythrobacter insulae]
MTRTSRLFAEWALLLVAAMGLMVFAQRGEWTERLDLQILDFAAQGMADEPDPSIVLIEIDDRSLAMLGSWPWGRDIHAQLIANLSAAKPKAIGVDILYIEPSDPKADAKLAEAVANAGNVVLAHTFGDGSPAEPATIPVFPIAPVNEVAAGVGHVSVTPQSDGTVRSFGLSTTENSVDYPHFTKALMALTEESGDLSSLPAEAIVPYHQSGAFRTEPAANVFNNEFIPDFFADKIVLIGATGQGLGDQYSVPGYAGGLMSGVEIQANLLSAMKQDQLITSASQRGILALQALAILILFIVFWRSSPRFSLIIAGGLIAALLFTTFATLRIGHVWVSTGPAILAITLAYPLWAWRRLATVSRFLEAEASSLRSATDDPERRAGEGFDVVARQVSRVKMLSGEVRRNLQLVQDVINASPDAMLVFDATGSISLANTAAKRLFGANCVEEAWTFTELLMTSTLTYDEERQELEFEDGSCFLLAKASIDPSVGSEVIVMRDITGIKADERQRRETLEFLSHDMRSPQVAIIGLTGNSGDTLAKQERLKRIESQARRTLKLTDDFVQIARISTEGIVREEVELNSILFETADRAFPLAHRKAISVVTRESEDPIFVKLDPAAIARTLDNLVGNAIKFSPENAEVILSVDVSNDDHFVIGVRDFGPGLPPERVKDPFARFGAKSDSAGPSAGLGLAYVKQVVDKHRGKITIETSAGKGTEFKVSIPYS